LEWDSGVRRAAAHAAGFWGLQDAAAVSGARPAGTKAPRRTPRKKKKKGRPPRPEPGGEDAVGADEADRAPGAVAGVGQAWPKGPGCGKIPGSMVLPLLLLL